MKDFETLNRESNISTDFLVTLLQDLHSNKIKLIENLSSLKKLRILNLANNQITSFVESPLLGENVEELGTRFPDMSNVYDVELTAHFGTIHEFDS